MKISQTKLKAKHSAKWANARKRGIDFSLDYQDLQTLFERNNGYCDYTGLPFTTKRVPSIERIDDKLGYVPGNLCLTCVQANQMKDNLLDKKHVQTFRIRKDSLDIFDALRTKITPEYLEHLKLKYRVDHNYNPNTDMYKDYFKDLTDEVVESILEENIVHEEKEPMSEEVKPTSTVKLPEDVHIATYYSALAKAAGKSGMEFQISYAEFKGRLSRKTCAFSGKNLETENKFMLVMDKEKPFCKANITVVDEDFGHKLTKMSEEMGLSVQQLAKMFKRLT